MVGFGETGEDIARGGGKEKEGAQGHGWTETWTACRSAPALSSECKERKRDVASYLSSKGGEEEGVKGKEGEGRNETRKGGSLQRKGVYARVFFFIFFFIIIIIDGAADHKYVRNADSGMNWP